MKNKFRTIEDAIAASKNGLCPYQGCTRSFEKTHGLSVHLSRTHGLSSANTKVIIKKKKQLERVAAFTFCPRCGLDLQQLAQAQSLLSKH